MFETPTNDLTQLIDIGGLEGGQRRLPDSNKRSEYRLVRATLWRERNSRWRSDQHEPGVLVTGIVQRVESTSDEGVVDRTDRQEPRSEQRTSQAQGREQDEQVIFGDAELDVLASGRPRPFLRRHDLGLRMDIATFL